MCIRDRSVSLSLSLSSSATISHQSVKSPSLSPSLCLSVSVSLCLSVSVSVSVSVSLSLSLSLSSSATSHQSVKSLSLSLSLSLSPPPSPQSPLSFRGLGFPLHNPRQWQEVVPRHPVFIINSHLSLKGVCVVTCGHRWQTKLVGRGAGVLVRACCTCVHTCARPVGFQRLLSGGAGFLRLRIITPGHLCGRRDVFQGPPRLTLHTLSPVSQQPVR